MNFPLRQLSNNNCIEERRLDEPQTVACPSKVVGTELEGGAEDPRQSRRSYWLRPTTVWHIGLRRHSLAPQLTSPPIPFLPFSCCSCSPFPVPHLRVVASLRLPPRRSPILLMPPPRWFAPVLAGTISLAVSTSCFLCLQDRLFCLLVACFYFVSFFPFVLSWLWISRTFFAWSKLLIWSM